MATIEISGDNLIVHIHGWDKLLALRSTLTLPLSHVRSAVARPGDAHYDDMEGVRLAGGYWPGSFAAGYFWVTGGVGGPAATALERLVGAREPLATAGDAGKAALGHLDAAIAAVKAQLSDAKLPDATRYLAFYDVHDPEKAIGLDVEHERLRRVVVQLDDEAPEAAVARVLSAIAGGGR
jgi:hypothetical protein